MADLKALARNAAMLGGISLSKKQPHSRYDQNLNRQYLASETQTYVRETAMLASNVYTAECQGYDEEDFYSYKTIKIRCSPAASSATGEMMPDDWQKVHVINPANLGFLPVGAYLSFGGNQWIVYKGNNIASALADGIIRRCNSVINTLDWYGNIVAVPMSYAKMGTLGNASHASENSIVAKNYISCICQLNEYSKSFGENTRLILGKTAYSMRGLNDFTREFTDDPDSVHLLSFTIERSEPLEQDSIELQCADYHSFSWDIRLKANKSMRTGTTQKIEVSSVRMGEAVEGTEEHPISYVFTSSDESILTISPDGIIYAQASGTANITVSLGENPKVQETIEISAAESGSSFVEFTTAPVSQLREYESAEISAAYFENGAATDAEISFEFTGAASNAYAAEKQGSNSYLITAYAASKEPLTIKVSANGYSSEMEIMLTSI